MTNAIADYLEQHLQDSIRRKGIVVWLDRDSRYTKFVDHLAERHQHGDFIAPVIRFRGSYLEMLLDLEKYGNGIDPEPLLIHLPTHNRTTVVQTPLLELYKAGKRYEYSLFTLVRDAASGKVTQKAIEDFLNENPDLTLETAEAWLQTELNRPIGDFATYLEGLELTWILDALLKKNSPLRSKINTDADALSLAECLHRRMGMNDDFLQFFLQPNPSFTKSLDANDLERALVAWLMCVEYANDLMRSPHLPELKPLRSLPKLLQEECAKLIAHLRDHYQDRYVEFAEDVAAKIALELEAIAAEDLGKIDTFQCEDLAVFNAAISALNNADWETAMTWAQGRVNAPSLWLQRDRKRRDLWRLVLSAATLGTAIAQKFNFLDGANNLREALEHYTQSGYTVDSAHRHFEQSFLKMLDTGSPQFSQIVTAAAELRQRYRQWANANARSFADLCDRQGFLPEAELQQRHLFENHVMPLLSDGKRVALFLIDACRYEMAADLFDIFQKDGHKPTLSGCYAELPTITAVGMNVLAPVATNGRIELPAGNDFKKGLRAGEYAVKDPDSRVRAMGDRSVDRVSHGKRASRGIELMQAAQDATDTLKRRCAGAELVVIHSREIDDAGEANVGIASFEVWLQQLTAARANLQKIGIDAFIFTADHGFLLLDGTVAEIEYSSATRRYVRLDEYRNESDTVTVSLRSLNYEGQEGYLLFRRDTAVFKGKTSSGSTFVHGGNTLQERVIPILTVAARAQSLPSLEPYRLEVQPDSDILGLSRLRVRVVAIPNPQGVLAFATISQLAIALRVPDNPNILVELRDASGATIKGQQAIVTVGEQWAELFFALTATIDGHTRVEVYHPTGIAQIETACPTTYFKVAGSTHQPTDEITVKGDRWQDRFDNPAIAKVFVHLFEHGSIVEAELTQMLGSARQARKFASDIEELARNVPFDVKVEMAASGKRYVKQ